MRRAKSLEMGGQIYCHTLIIFNLHITRTMTVEKSTVARQQGYRVHSAQQNIEMQHGQEFIYVMFMRLFTPYVFCLPCKKASFINLSIPI